MKYWFLGKKKKEFYKNLTIKADLGLHAQIAERVVREVPDGGTILDLGAGEGALSSRLTDLGFQVTAADIDQTAFKCSEVRFSRVNFDSPQEVARFVDRHEGEFDAVLGIEVIEHVQDPWQYVRQLMTMVKPDGLILITTPNITSWLSRLSFFFTGRFHQFSDADLEYGHINPISPWELELILRESGAHDVSIRSAGTLPPIYITKLSMLAVLNILILPIRFVMSGLLDGWCVMATARRRK